LPCTLLVMSLKDVQSSIQPNNINTKLDIVYVVGSHRKQLIKACSMQSEIFKIYFSRTIGQSIKFQLCLSHLFLPTLPHLGRLSEVFVAIVAPNKIRVGFGVVS